MAKEKNIKIHSVGRRKTSVCTVNMVKGDGENLVNKKNMDEYFTLPEYKERIVSPFVVTKTLGDYHFTAKISGGGIVSQADALRLAIARSLASLDEEMHTTLSKEGLLTRDPRSKERKKVFFLRARKKPQYSKR